MASAAYATDPKLQRLRNADCESDSYGDVVRVVPAVLRVVEVRRAGAYAMCDRDAMKQNLVSTLLIAVVLMLTGTARAATPTATATATHTATATPTATPTYVPFSAAAPTTALIQQGAGVPPTLVDGEIAVLSGPSSVAYNCCASGGCSIGCTRCCAATSMGALHDSSSGCVCAAATMTICVTTTGTNASGTTLSTP